MRKTKELMLLLMLTISCVSLSCAHACPAPIVVIKGIDYDDGKSDNEPKDRATWMWVTYETAKRQLKWINHQ